MSESQTLKTMVHEVAHSMLHNKEINRDDLMEAPAEYSVAAKPSVRKNGNHLSG